MVILIINILSYKLYNFLGIKDTNLLKLKKRKALIN